MRIFIGIIIGILLGYVASSYNKITANNTAQNTNNQLSKQVTVVKNSDMRVCDKLMNKYMSENTVDNIDPSIFKQDCRCDDSEDEQKK